MKGLVLANKAVSIQENLEIPVPQRNEVLVKIKYASINSFDLENIEGKNDLIGKLLGAQKHPVQTGLEFSGVVESDGIRFKKGDNVFGYPDLIRDAKAHQEYIAINEDFIALIPSNLNFLESTAIPLGALTSLVALEGKANIRNQAKVLINGAAGGLGVYAVQIAKIFNADITAVAGPGQEAFLKELGANKVINYKTQNIEVEKEKYDIVFDLTTKVKFSTIKKNLTSNGVFIPANPFTELLSIATNALRKKKVAYLMVDKGDYRKLTRIAEWVEQGKLKPVIDKVYTFQEYEQAFKRILEAGKRGRIIIKIEE